MSGNYDDIIDLEHPTSTKHPRMSMESRAAQFGSFAALTGFEDLITETTKDINSDVRLREDQTDPELQDSQWSMLPED